MKTVSFKFFGSLLLLLSSAILSEPGALAQATRPFQPGEELTYKAEISRSLLKKIDVATFRFRVEAPPKNAHNANYETQLRFVGDVVSEGFFTRLFNLKFHQHVESIVDPESLAVQRTIKLDEQGKRVRTSEATFDSKAGKVTWVERDPNDPSRGERTLSSEFSGIIQDVVSAIYYLRTQQLGPGANLQIKISDSGRVYDVPVSVTERKQLKTVLGRVDSIHVVPQIFGSGKMLDTKGELSLWLTADERHIPVKAQLKGDFGTFDITLKQLSNVPSRPK